MVTLIVLCYIYMRNITNTGYADDINHGDNAYNDSSGNDNNRSIDDNDS